MGKSVVVIGFVAIAFFVTAYKACFVKS